MSNFRPINRDTGFLLPPSVDEWLPQRHMARFVVEVIDGLDLSELQKAYRGSGSASYHPAMLLGLLVYGYATGVFSSRAIERATCDSVAFRFLAGNEHPDHDTIATFRKRFLKQIESLFVEVLQLARAMGMLKVGTVAIDGTPTRAATARCPTVMPRRSRSSCAGKCSSCCAWPSARTRQISPTGCRSRKSWNAAGKKPGGRPPAAPSGGVQDSDQINLTDDQSRIMRVAGNRFEQCYNAQAAVAVGSLLIVANAVTQAGNDKQQLAPMIEQLRALPKALARVKRAIADNGYFSQANVETCAAAKIEPLIAAGREQHHTSWKPLEWRLQSLSRN
jgi:transposase